MSAPPSHQPFYCEENIWLLAQRKDLIDGEAEVVFVFGPGDAAFDDPRVACWQQRAAEPGEAVLWDYHVVLAEPHAGAWRVWDLDTRLPCPCPAALWLPGTFNDAARVPARYHPRFRVVPSAIFVRELASDRSHMRDDQGRYRRPPPPWDPPGAGGSNLASWIGEGPRDPRRGVVLDRAGLEARWGVHPARRR